jgi:hypothetical protein
MNATTSRTRKPERRIGVVAREGEFFLIELQDGKKLDYYISRKIASDWGQAFQLEKQDAVGLAEVYHVLLAGRESTCTCRGFCFHQRPCKHITGLQALASTCKLPGYKSPSLQEVSAPFRPGRTDEPSPRFVDGLEDIFAPSSPWRSAGDYAANDPTGWEQHCLDISDGDHAA